MKKNKFLNVLFLLAASSFGGTTHAAFESGILSISQTASTVAYESDIRDPESVTLILMPGIYRGWNRNSQDQILQELSQRKINWVAFQFSGHPLSRIQSSANPSQNSITTEFLAEESLALALELGIRHPLFVPLSYSSAASSHFLSTDVELLIETAPLVEQDETDVGSSQLVKSNNLFCSSVMMQWTPYCVAWQSQKSLYYSSYWSTYVSGLVTLYPELQDDAVFSSVVEGYMSMAQAVENYDYTETDFSEGPRRLFILGENEEPARLALQLAAIEEYQSQTNHTPYVFVIREAGHVIPSDQPVAYAAVLSRVIKNQLPEKPGVYAVTVEGEIESSPSH